MFPFNVIDPPKKALMVEQIGLLENESVLSHELILLSPSDSFSSLLLHMQRF